MHLLSRPFRRLLLSSLAGLAAALGSSGALAQSLLQLYQAAQAHDAPYRAAQASAQASQARAEQARAGLLPQVQLQAGAQRNWLDAQVGTQSGNRTYNAYSSTLTGAQPLYRPANRITYEQGQQAAQAARVQLDAAGQDLLMRLAQAYFDVLAAQDSLHVVRALKAAVAQQLQAAQQNFELGNASITDSREAQARYDLSSAQEIAADNELRTKQLALTQLTGLPQPQPWPLAPDAGSTQALPRALPPEEQPWIDTALAQHPQVLQARLAVQMAQLETDKAKTGHLPTIDLQASVGHSRYPQGNPSLSMAPDARYRATQAGVGVVLNWPLFAGFAVQNRVRETLSLQEQAQADLAHAERSVTQATRAAYLGLQAGLSQVAALQAAEASSLTALQANQMAYQVGLRINIDVLNAQSQLYQTRRDLARARYDVLLGLLRLKQAAGNLSEADLRPINALLQAPGSPQPEPAAPAAPAGSAVPAAS